MERCKICNWFLVQRHCRNCGAYKIQTDIATIWINRKAVLMGTAKHAIQDRINRVARLAGVR